VHHTVGPRVKSQHLDSFGAKRNAGPLPERQRVLLGARRAGQPGCVPRFGLELPELCPDKLTGLKRVSRRAMSAPSSGSTKVHALEQQELIDEAFR
jgi:2-oxoglutarate dehydrogenase complex dehydrogenase (E1) component-like enzyme